MLASRVQVPRRAERRRMPGEEEPKCARWRARAVRSRMADSSKAKRTRGTLNAPKSEFAICTAERSSWTGHRAAALRKTVPRCDVGSDRLQLVAHGMSAGLDVRAASRTGDTKETVHLVDTKFYGFESSSSRLSLVIDPGVLLPREPLWMRSAWET